MLVLSRKLGESIVIAGEITVTVCHIKGNQVRLGITAPSDVPVHREEIARLKTRSSPFAAELARS